MRGAATVHLTVADLPDGHLPRHWGEAKDRLRRFGAPAIRDWFSVRSGTTRTRITGCSPSCCPLSSAVPAPGLRNLKWETDLPTPNVLPTDLAAVGRGETPLLHEYYPSQADKFWFDEEAFRGLLRIRGVQCRSRHAEAFVADKISLRLGGC